MMATTTTLGDCLDNLRTLLAARGALDGVVITTGDHTADPDEREVLSIHSAHISREPMGAGEMREETISIDGRYDIFRAGQIVGTADASAKNARDRALIILAELDDQISDDPTIGGAVAWSRLIGYDWSDNVTDLGHLTRIDFTVAATAHLIR